MKLLLSKTNFFLALICLVFFANCKQIDLHEHNITIPNSKWESSLIAKDSFKITDSTSLYNVFIVLRHTDAYEYNNIWLSVGLQESVREINVQKLNINLANDAKGWDGIGMNDIWEVRKQIIFKKRLSVGTYKTFVGQIMRQNPLLHIMNVGVRVEKTS